MTYFIDKLGSHQVGQKLLFAVNRATIRQVKRKPRGHRVASFLAETLHLSEDKRQIRDVPGRVCPLSVPAIHRGQTAHAVLPVDPDNRFGIPIETLGNSKVDVPRWQI